MPRRDKKQILEKQSREFVVLLRDYFEREQQNGGPLLPLTRVVERVSDALQIGTNTVCRITREKYGKSGMEDNELKTPSKPRTRRRRKTAVDESSKSTAGVNKVPKECNPRVNGVSTNKSKSKIITTVSNINTNLKTVPHITSSRGKLQKTCVTKTVPKIAPRTDLMYELPKICNPMVSGFENATEKSMSGVKTDDTKCPFSKTSIKRKRQNTSLSKSPLDPLHIEIPCLSPVIHGPESITESTINSYHKKDHLIGETSTKRKCRTISSKSLLDPLYDMPNIFSPTLSDFGTTDSTITDVKSGNKNNPIHTSTKTNPTKYHSIKLQFKEELDDNIILVVHPTIDDHLPMNSWQNNKTLY